MKTYEFPYGTNEWDAIISVDLTDDEAARLESSAKKGTMRMCWDKDIDDIYKKVYQAAYELNKQMIVQDGRLKELRDTWEYFNNKKPPEQQTASPTDDELIEEELDGFCVSYPETLQPL